MAIAKNLIVLSVYILNLHLWIVRDPTLTSYMVRIVYILAILGLS